MYPNRAPESTQNDMPISAEQWRATTGSLNACKTLTTARPKALKLWRCRILPAGSLRLSVSSWKCGYITALTVALLCIPLLYNMYLAVMYQIRGEAKKSLGDSGKFLSCCAIFALTDANLSRYILLLIY